MHDRVAETANTPTQENRTGFYAWYVVVVLTLGQALSMLDAKLPFILVEALKADLKLSDTQVGLITGPAFSLTYAVCAIPIAKISDRHVRTRVINIAVIIWSGLTAAGGAATGFATFALSRVGVAAGEAAFVPAAHSIMADYTTPTSRPRAMAVFGFGSALGVTAAMALGGLISDLYGWRAALFLVGAIGVVFVLLIALTVKEPIRTTDGKAHKDLPKSSIKSLLSNGGIRNIMISGALMGLALGGLQAWSPAFIMRTFGLSATATGASFGLATGLTSAAGLLLGGFVAGWLNKTSQGKAFRVLAVCFLIASVAQIGALIAGNYYVFLALTGISMLLLASYFAPTFSGIQSLAPANARSLAAAIAIFAVNGVGGASGSFLAGLFSDLLRPALGADSLRWSLILLSCVIPWSAFHYYLAARAIDKAELGPVRSAG